MLQELFGSICVLFAALFMLRVIIKQRMINKPDIEKCNGYVVDNVMKDLGQGIFVFFPVYEYERHDRKYKLQSKYTSLKPIPIGEKIKIYINPKTNEPMEQPTILAEATLSFCFGAFGILLTILSSLE